MKKYHQINQKKMLKTITGIHELSEKFPKITFSDLNLSEYAKRLGLSEKDFISVRVFLHCLKEKKMFLEVQKIHSLVIKRKEDKWQFTITTMDKKTITSLEYTYSL